MFERPALVSGGKLEGPLRMPDDADADGGPQPAGRVIAEESGSLTLMAIQISGNRR